jgi:hypothetical protein
VLCPPRRHICATRVSAYLIPQHQLVMPAWKQ